MGGGITSQARPCRTYDQPEMTSWLIAHVRGTAHFTRPKDRGRRTSYLAVLPDKTDGRRTNSAFPFINRFLSYVALVTKACRGRAQSETPSGPANQCSLPRADRPAA
jgi:hypothetical protein